MNTPGNKAAKKALDIVPSKSGPLPVTWVSRAFDERATPGAANWRKPENGAGQYLQYVCPCGCGEFRSLPVATGDKRVELWKWDGNETAPTITPSIRHVPHQKGDCAWHGYMTKGQWGTV